MTWSEASGVKVSGAKHKGSNKNTVLQQRLAFSETDARYIPLSALKQI